MKLKYIICILFFTVSILTTAQEDGFRLTDKTKSEIIPFQIVKNLLIIPLELNGQKMNFIIDSGLKETILFARYQNFSNHKNLKEVKLKGLGSSDDGSIGYFSSNNQIKIHQKYYNPSAQIIIIQDENFDLFSRLGMDVHGIIGYEFFKNYPIKIDYLNQKITIYKSNAFIKNISKYEVKDIKISRDKKPYIEVDFFQDKLYENQKMLVDIGNSDGLWLFKSEFDDFSPPQNAFYDDLGKGFNGTISGERGTIYELRIGKYKFNNPLIAIPDSNSIQFLQLEKSRKGSVGNEILRRFTIILDYNDQKIYYKSNRHIKDPFHYNRSGLTIIHDQYEWKKTSVGVTLNSNETNDNNVSTHKMNYQFVMKPIYKIETIRKNSNAEKAGLKMNDRLETLNGKLASKMTLTDIENFMLNNEHKEISIGILRNNQPMKFRFTLEIPYDKN